MSDTDTGHQPSWKKYVNFAGPTGFERHVAITVWNEKRVEASQQSGGNLKYGTPRKGKHNRQMRPHNI